ncbi:MAG: 30S ribosomal protein S12 methylthiotransferase RimO [Planctomycetota bacterium]
MTSHPPQPETAPAAEPVAPSDHGVNSVAFVSLGCPKNLVDSEKMLGLLAEDGILPVPAEAMDDGEADAVVINTCGFLEASKLESVEEINRAAELKKQGLVKRVVVAGCLVQRHRAKLLEWCPDIDAMIGVFDRDRITPAVLGNTTLTKRAADRDVAVELPVFSSIAASATIAREHRQLNDDQHIGYHEDDSARLRLTPRHYAYLRISEGCNQNCAFCTIPSIRGRMRSKPVDRILTEARELFNDGAYELSLIGQDTTSYGEDIAPGSYPGHDQHPDLSGMLTALDQLATEYGGAWLRLMYAYPSCFTDEMIDTITSLRHVLPYIDMPLQHINDRVLDRMRRKTSRRLIETLLGKLRDRIPGMTIRTTFISGFPGETDAEHQELVDFVRDFGFENMGVFPYSPEPGTRAAKLHRADAIPDDVITQRIDELMLTQQDVAFGRAARLAQDRAVFDVLIDGPAEVDEAGNPVRYAGRTVQQAPDIDALTYVDSTQPLVSGELVRCVITDADGYDLIAQPEEQLQRRVTLPVMR